MKPPLKTLRSPLAEHFHKSFFPVDSLAPLIFAQLYPIPRLSLTSTPLLCPQLFFLSFSHFFFSFPPVSLPHSFSLSSAYVFSLLFLLLFLLFPTFLPYSSTSSSTFFLLYFLLFSLLSSPTFFSLFFVSFLSLFPPFPPPHFSSFLSSCTFIFSLLFLSIFFSFNPFSHPQSSFSSSSAFFPLSSLSFLSPFLPFSLQGCCRRES